MDARELALTMLKWESLRAEIELVERQIQDAVLLLGKTQNVGNVRASYSKGRKAYDYKTPGMAAPVEIIERYTRTETTVDWRAVCLDAEINAVVVSETAPSVIVKLVSEP